MLSAETTEHPEDAQLSQISKLFQKRGMPSQLSIFWITKVINKHSAFSWSYRSMLFVIAFENSLDAINTLAVPWDLYKIYFATKQTPLTRNYIMTITIQGATATPISCMKAIVCFTVAVDMIA